MYSITYIYIYIYILAESSVPLLLYPSPNLSIPTPPAPSTPLHFPHHIPSHMVIPQPSFNAPSTITIDHSPPLLTTTTHSLIILLYIYIYNIYSFSNFVQTFFCTMY